MISVCLNSLTDLWLHWRFCEENLDWIAHSVRKIILHRRFCAEDRITLQILWGKPQCIADSVRTTLLHCWFCEENLVHRTFCEENLTALQILWRKPYRIAVSVRKTLLRCRSCEENPTALQVVWGRPADTVKKTSIADSEEDLVALQIITELQILWGKPSCIANSARNSLVPCRFWGENLTTLPILRGIPY